MVQTIKGTTARLRKYARHASDVAIAVLYHSNNPLSGAVKYQQIQFQLEAAARAVVEANVAKYTDVPEAVQKQVDDVLRVYNNEVAHIIQSAAEKRRQQKVLEGGVT